MSNTVQEQSTKAREMRLRRMAARQGMGIHKSRVREPNLDNFGGYMLYDLDGNYVVAGARFDLDLDDVERWLTPDEDAA